MITPEYCRTMARYNTWQNDGLRRIVSGMGRAELEADRGAFFGSIWGTLNHLLWGDQIWLSRFDGGAAPKGGIADSPTLTRNRAEWQAERFQTDGRIRVWAEKLSALELVGDLTWFSGAKGAEVTRPMALCVTHFFNHQTHHRGQIHAMQTAAGQRPEPTDLVLMP